MPSWKRSKQVGEAANFGDGSPPRNVEDMLAEEVAATRSVQRRGLKYLALAAIGLVILVVAAPQIVCRTPLLGRLINWGASDLRGTVDVESASLNWFTPPQARGVRVVDEQGKVVLEAETVVSDRTLWDLAANSTRLGRLRVERPKLRLVTRADNTTNVEHVIKHYLEAEGASAPVDVAVEFVDGTAEIFDEVSNKSWQIEKLNGVVIVPAAASSPLSVDLQGAVAYSGGPRPFTFRMDFRNAAEEGATNKPTGEVATDISAIPLELIGALTRRFTPGVNFSGTATGKLQSRFDWSAAQPTVTAEGNLSFLQPVVGGPLLRGDELRMARVDMPLKVVLSGRRLQLDRLGFGCDLAAVDVRMVIDDYTQLLYAGSLSGLLNVLTHCDGQATARLNLAQLAQAVPHVLRLRDEVQVTGGELVANVVSSRNPDGERQWQADLTAGNLTATSNGRTTTWSEPLTGSLLARDTATGPVVDRINCRSEFLVVAGRNSPASFDIDAEYSLDRLVERLSQFIDFGGIQLRGAGTAQASWTRERADRFRVEGTAAVREFELLAPGYPAWTEHQLVVGMRAVGRAAGLSIATLDEATLGLDSAGDQLTARITSPVADLQNSQAMIPLVIEGRGQLATWLARIRPFAGLPKELSGDGQLQLSAVGQIRLPDEVTIAESKLTATPLRLSAYGIAIDEPNAELSVIGRHAPAGTEIREAVLNSPGTQALIRNLAYLPNPGRAPDLNGEFGLRADVAKLLAPTLASWTATPGAKSMQLGGIVEASGKLERTGAVTAVALDAVVRDFLIGQTGSPAWREPQLRLVGSGIYEPTRDALSFDRLELAGDALRVLLNGKLEQLSLAQLLDCRGELTYDLAKLTPLAQAYLGQGVSLAGRSTQQFQVAGALVDRTRPGTIAWHQLKGATRLGWEQLNLYGFVVPRGNVDVGLEQGIVRTSAVEVPIGTGRIRLAPALRIGPEPLELRLEPGMLADHVTITQEMANERLKYVMPILAGVAQVGGQFSVSLDEFRLPLENVAAGAIGGKMTVHNVDVGPGVLTQELAALLGRSGSVGLTRESTVDFKMIEGRIYHQNLEFAFPQVTMRTMGSVGVVDQSLSLMAEVPIPSQMLANLPVANAALAGQVIRVPIAGTLTRPALDREAFRQATSQFLQSAAQGALQQALGAPPAEAAQGAVNRGQNAATDFLQRGTNAAQDALNRGSSAAQGALNRGLNRLLGPGAANPATGTETR